MAGQQLDRTATVLVLLLASGWLLLDGEYLFALVMTTVRADRMRQTHLVTIWASHEVRRFHRQMAATSVAPSLG